MPDDVKADPQGQSATSKEDPKSGSNGESSEKKSTEALSNLPEKFQGKSTEELIRAYGELERKLGEQSTLVSEAKQLKENQALLAKAIYSNPKLVKQVEEAIMGVSGRKPDPETLGKKDDGEAGTSTESSQVKELRRAHENRVIAEFSAKYGLNDMKAEERQDMMKKIGTKLADMVDPSGKKSVSEVLSRVDLEKLPGVLEDVYFLVNRDALMDKGAVPRDFASIGRFSSSTPKSGETETLTDEERAVAEKLGVDPEKYLKQKKQANKK